MIHYTGMCYSAMSTNVVFIVFHFVGASITAITSIYKCNEISLIDFFLQTFELFVALLKPVITN